MKMITILVLILIGQNLTGQNSFIGLELTNDFEKLEIKNIDASLVSIEKLEQNLSIYLGHYHAGKVPIWGKYELSDSVIAFVPVLPFAQGENYEVVLNQTMIQDRMPNRKIDENQLHLKFTVPETDLTTYPFVENVYPTSEFLPLNTLKFHIDFSQPMKTGQALEYIHLIDKTSGQKIEHVFADYSIEFWDELDQRLTIYFDPGRLKKGLLLNRTLGSPLISQHEYQLRIDSTWENKVGQRLSSTYRKDFTVTEEDRLSPKMANWELILPDRNTKNSLEIKFPEPMDVILAERSFVVIDHNGDPFNGDVKIEDEERRWIFYPTSNWNQKNYKVLVYSGLADRSGNMLKGLFERNVNSSESLDHVDYYEIDISLTSRMLNK